LNTKGGITEDEVQAGLYKFDYVVDSLSHLGFFKGLVAGKNALYVSGAIVSLGSFTISIFNALIALTFPSHFVVILRSVCSSFTDSSSRSKSS